jgi:hypothetical protein
MTPQTPAPLDELWDALPTGHAPVEHLIARGSAVRRRRRLAFLGAAVIFVVGALVLTGLLVRPGGGQEVSVVTPPPGTRNVGIGQVVVAVPEGWAEGAASCNVPRQDTVYFPWPQDCVGAFHSVSSVALSTVRMNDGFTAGLLPDGHVGIHQVVSRQAMCTAGTGPEHCSQALGVPDLHAYFEITVPRAPGGSDQIAAIRDSLRLLPEDQTAVPFVNPMSPLATWRAALENAGFAVRENHATCPPTGNCNPGVVLTRPAAGNVAPTGSTVTIEVQD